MTQSKDGADTILERLARGDLLVSDGATGTYLQAHGLEPGGCPEELNTSRPDTVKAMAEEYFAAGADIVLTNSFGGSRFMLKKYGHADRVAKLNRLAAQHARSVAPDGRYVIGSVGPTGELLEPLGEVVEEEMLDAFNEQISALKAGGADGVDIETMFAIEEASLAIKAAERIANLTVMATMTFDKGPRGFFTMMGVTPERAVKELQDAGADIVGANCGNGIEVMVELARELRRATDGYLLMHSNAGIPTIRKGQIIYPETPEYMVPGFKELADLGFNIVGGCCGTTPKHIEALAQAVGKGR